MHERTATRPTLQNRAINRRHRKTSNQSTIPSTRHSRPPLLFKGIYIRDQLSSEFSATRDFFSNQRSQLSPEFSATRDFFSNQRSQLSPEFSATRDFFSNQRSQLIPRVLSNQRLLLKPEISTSNPEELYPPTRTSGKVEVYQDWLNIPGIEYIIIRPFLNHQYPYRWNKTPKIWRFIFSQQIRTVGAWDFLSQK